MYPLNYYFFLEKLKDSLIESDPKDNDLKKDLPTCKFYNIDNM